MKKCQYCGEEFQPKNKQQKYCRPGCGRLADRDRKRERKASGKGKYEFVCKGCGVTYHTDHKNRDQYCSRECAYKHMHQWHKPVEPTATIKCRVCGGSCLRADAISGVYCSEDCKAKAWSGACERCGALYENRRPGAKYCADCAYKISVEKACARSKEKYVPVTPTKHKCVFCGDTFKSSRGAKYCRHCAKKRGHGSNYQRAKMFGVKRKKFGERAILKRDGWRCYICGVDTPEELRGTFEDNAPEIDHVVPMSKGGSHTPDNVRCCCRRCNAAKCDRELKEFRQQAEVSLFAMEE